MGIIINARWGILLCLAAALSLQGCTGLLLDQREVTIKDSRIQREMMQQSAWVGRPYSELVAAYGLPRRLLFIPGNRPYEAVAVYGVRDDASRCIDAFTVFHGSRQTALNDNSVVTNYFCR